MCGDGTVEKQRTPHAGRRTGLMVIDGNVEMLRYW